MAGNELTVRPTAVPGLLVVQLPLHGDSRGWFKENWQRAKMTALGLPDFAPVQHSVAYNEDVGVTRGIHAEPWDKFVSVATGRAFGAWVDLREGPSFGAVHTEVLDPGTAVFVPRGVGNSYQTLEPGTVYSYLVNAHWSADAQYTHLNLADERAAVPWPIPLADAVISEKDLGHPRLGGLTSVQPRSTVIVGASGQVGRALQRLLPDAIALTRAELDLADPAAIESYDFSQVGTVINAAAHTAVDLAETDEGRPAAWSVNATAVSRLAAAAREHRFTLVHYSTDYVFDGTGGSGADGGYREDDPIAPLGVYGQSKAAGEAALAQVPGHYLLRTSWVVGDGRNFIATMRDLARRGVSPTVVNDQVGRLTFADDLAEATVHLLESGAAPGTYHVSNGGDPASWADIASWVFELEGREKSDVRGVSTHEYFAAATKPVAPRPGRSVLDLTKIEATGWVAPHHRRALEQRWQEP